MIYYQKASKIRVGLAIKLENHLPNLTRLLSSDDAGILMSTLWRASDMALSGPGGIFLDIK